MKTGITLSLVLCCFTFSTHGQDASPQSTPKATTLSALRAPAPFELDALAQSDFESAPLAADKAAHNALVPDGFEVTVLASEPTIQQPIGFCMDDRARLWVAEAYSYPVHTGENAGDRIVILEDTDGDGQHDKRVVFYEGLNYVTGIEYGFGGVWVMSPPYFYFIPDRDHDDRPDGPPEVLLDGFGNHSNAHNLANGFAWGPDGWLYGTHGRTNWSMIGKPGATEDERRRFDGGVYRYHPIRHVWEPYADGTTNPWGIDWNDYGHAFICNCVNPHLFQVIQGAHYEPWRGRKSSQYAYQRIDTVADHLHFTGLSNIRTGLGSPEEDAAGGGHAHCGTMIYLGDNFPEAYRNTLFTNNVHGRRINNDRPRRHGSGYTASHEPDLLRSADPWFMGVTLAYGPAGEVYVSDWNDTGECHSTKNTQRGTGRIYRITYGHVDRPTVDLSNLSNAQLVDLQTHKNDWYVRHARRLLQERFAAGQDMTVVHQRLRNLLTSAREVPQKLRALWSLHVLNGLDQSTLSRLLSHQSEDIRSWVIKLLCETENPPSEVVHQFVEMARNDASALVRLSLASALQRLDIAKRWELATALASRSEDIDDANLPLMIWYGSEPLNAEDVVRFAELGATAEIPRVRINVARRIADSSDNSQGLQALLAHLGSSRDDAVSNDLLEGILQGLEGRRSLPMPQGWRHTHNWLSSREDSEIQDKITRLAVIFNDGHALDRLRAIATDSSSPALLRNRAIDTLVSQRTPGFGSDLLALVSDKPVRASALRGLASYSAQATAETILSHYPSLDQADRQHAQLTLASRPDWSRALLKAIAAGHIDANDLTAFTVRQMQLLGDAGLNAQLADHWGKLRNTSSDKVRQIQAIKRWLSDEVLAQADMAQGKMLFQKHCATCHTFFGEGNKVGPDITGAQRHNLDYMLENMVDPSSTVSKDYLVEVLQMFDGRIITGLIESETAGTIALQTLNERLVFPSSDVEVRKTSNVSMMPDGILDPLSETQIRDLMGYIQRQQP